MPGSGANLGSFGIRLFSLHKQRLRPHGYCSPNDIEQTYFSEIEVTEVRRRGVRRQRGDQMLRRRRSVPSVRPSSRRMFPHRNSGKRPVPRSQEPPMHGVRPIDAGTKANVQPRTSRAGDRIPPCDAKKHQIKHFRPSGRRIAQWIAYMLLT